MFLRYGFGFLLFLAFSTAAVTPSAHSGPALVVLIDNGDSNLAYRQFMEAFGYVVTTNQLGRKYDVISVLSGPRATGADLFREIRRRAEKRWVDVVILSHGLPGKLALTLGNLTAEQIERESPIAHLRMVYMMACYGSTLVRSWEKIGAQSVIGHQDVNSLVPFFFPQFLLHWGQGVFIDDAALLAHRTAVQAARSLNPFVKDKEDYLSETGIQKSYPVVTGKNLNIEGVSKSPSSFLRGVLFSKDALPRKTGTVQSTVAELAGSLIPQIAFDPERFRSPDDLIEVLKPSLWGSLQAAFPNHVAENLSQGEAESIWMDGDSLRLMADPLREWAGAKFAAVMSRLQGVRLDPTASGLRVGVYVDRSVDFDLEGILGVETSKKSLGRPLALHVPKTVRLKVSVQQGVLKIQGFDQGVDSVVLTVAGPLGTKWKVWPRFAELDLESGKLRVQAAVIGNKVSLWAEGDVMAKKITGFSFWDTVESNLPLFEWPELRFLPMQLLKTQALFQ